MSISFDEIYKNVLEIKNDLLPYPNAIIQAVTKMQSNESIEFVKNECGISHFGENHVQEYIQHKPAFENATVDMIGKLQTNKVKYLIGSINIIQSLDSIHLCDEINKQSAKKGIVTKVFIEVNIASEESKSGVSIIDFPYLIEHASKSSNIEVCGLMTLSQNTQDESLKQKYFADLRKLRDEYLPYFSGYDDHPLLSMGMSESYKEALYEGADIIRLGQKIFGKRIYQNQN